MNQLDLDPSSVLARARAGLSPTEADRERVHRAMTAALAASAVAGVVSAGAPVRAAATGLRWASRLFVAGAVAAAAGGVGYQLGYRAGRQTAPGVTSPAARPSAVEPIAAPAVPVVPLPVAPPSAARPHQARPVAAPIATPAASLDAEVRALRSVERALRDHEPGMALALLRELDRTVPDGKLVEEREATAAIARCTLGDVPFGVKPARDFADRHADSVYLERVEQACAPKE